MGILNRTVQALTPKTPQEPASIVKARQALESAKQERTAAEKAFRVADFELERQIHGSPDQPNRTAYFAARVRVLESTLAVESAQHALGDAIFAELLASGDPDAIACDPIHVKEDMEPVIAELEVAHSGLNESECDRCVALLCRRYRAAVAGRAALMERYAITAESPRPGPPLPALKGFDFQTWLAEFESSKPAVNWKVEDELEQRRHALVTESARCEELARAREEREAAKIRDAAERAESWKKHTEHLAEERAKKDAAAAAARDAEQKRLKALAAAYRKRQGLDQPERAPQPEGTPSKIETIDRDKGLSRSVDPRKQTGFPPRA